MCVSSLFSLNNSFNAFFFQTQHYFCIKNYALIEADFFSFDLAFEAVFFSASDTFENILHA